MPRKRSAVVAGIVASMSVWLLSCAKTEAMKADSKREEVAPIVAVTKVGRKPMARYLTMSSELVPFQEIDVFAKVAGYVTKLYVDYGSRVKKGQLMATLEIPEMQALLEEDKASIKAAADQVTNAEHQIGSLEAQHKVLHLQYERLSQVVQTRPGLVAQQEVDDAQGKDLAAEAQVEGAKANLQLAQSQMAVAQSKLAHDQALYNYANITAPFSGVVTERYANLGTLMQAGTNSSTQAMPLVKLSQEDKFRLVIPVPESYVRYIKIGDPVNVQVPSLNRTFPGKVARFSVDVTDTTRTMHTEVDVPNSQGALIAGVYAEATLTLDRKGDALVVPLQAINQASNQPSVLVINEAKQIETRPITTGIRDANDAEVLSGLKAGDEVVISDRSGLRAGETVSPKEIEAATYQAQN